MNFLLLALNILWCDDESVTMLFFVGAHTVWMLNHGANVTQLLTLLFVYALISTDAHLSRYSINDVKRNKERHTESDEIEK